MGTAARGRAFAMGLVTACTIAVAGCSADPDDQPTEATPSSPTPTDDQTKPPGNQVTEPTLPADAEGSSIRSAKAFVGYYIDLLNYAMVTGDTKTFRAAGQQNCGGCADYVDLFASTYERGGFFKSRGWSLDRVLLGSRSAKQVQFTVTATAAPITFRERGGGQLKRSKRDPLDFSLVLEKGGAAWAVRDFFA